MSSLSRNRPLLISGILLPVVLLGTLLYVRSRPAHIGDFSMPNLPGWSQNIFKKPRYERIIYTQKANDHTSTINMVWQAYRDTNPPKNVQDLESEIAQGRVVVARLSKVFKYERQDGAPRTISLHGLPAVETDDVVIDKNHRKSYQKSIYFIKGSHYYILHADVFGSVITPEAQAELDKALATVTQFLTPA